MHVLANSNVVPKTTGSRYHHDEIHHVSLRPAGPLTSLHKFLQGQQVHPAAKTAPPEQSEDVWYCSPPRPGPPPAQGSVIQHSHTFFLGKQQSKAENHTNYIGNTSTAHSQVQHQHGWPDHNRGCGWASMRQNAVTCRLCCCSGAAVSTACCLLLLLLYVA